MKSLLLLWKALACETASMCSTSTTMDIKVVHRRVKHEGLSFLTITLPSYGKDLEKGLDQGYVDRRLFSSFKRKGELPLFLGGFLDRVFSRDTGQLLDDPCIDSIRALRQLTLMFGKIAIPCSDARNRKAMREYVKCEQEVRESDKTLGPVDSEAFKRISSLVFSSMFSKVDREIYDGNVVPKHGPGSTADGLMGNRKYHLRTWTTRLEERFPFGEFLFPSHSYYNLYESVDLLEPGSELPVKVITVPKTLKTPRIIAMEPSWMMFVQQGILELLTEYTERDNFLKVSISSSSQLPNQRLAEKGSRNGAFATLDLSEASDRVSNQHVRLLLSNFPHLNGAVDACRSRKADVDGHGVLRLAKFASMGSALCFPFEAMVFLTVTLVGIEQGLNRPMTRKDLNDLSGQVRVYGDDIIVPTDYVHSVDAALSRFGFRVNSGKSFWTGKFRESCGKEYYDGFDVSICRFRREFPTSRRDASEVISLISFRNQLYFAGYWETCKWLDRLITRLIKHYPVVLPSSSALGRHSFLGYQTDRMCDELHRPLVKAHVVTSKLPRNEVSDVGALHKYFLKRGLRPFDDREHMMRSGRPRAVYTKPRWVTPF